VLIASKNEAVNLPRCLSRLDSFERVVVIDSHSTDETTAIAAQFGAEVVQFDYDGGPVRKRQWALDNLAVETPWIMLLDADEAVPAELQAEVSHVISDRHSADAYLITKEFHFLGRRFRFGGFSHAAVALFRNGRAKFERLLDVPADGLDMEVHERLIVDGQIRKLRTPLVHQDFKGLTAYIDRHNKYSTWEAHVRWQLLTTGKWGTDAIVPRLLGNSQERRRFLKAIVIRIPGESWLWFGYHFLLRGGILEGRRGLIACQIRSQYIAQVRAKLFELMLNRRTASNAARDDATSTAPSAIAPDSPSPITPSTAHVRS
jgi:glycosyltransferase involved in cell wall biosynthesis